MKDFSDEEIAAYSSRTIIKRNLIYVWAIDRETGETREFGFWDGTGDATLDCLDGVAAAVVARDFSARGALLQVGSIPQTNDLTVQSVQVTLSQLNADVTNALRGYDLRQAEIQIYRAVFNPENPRAMVAPARCRFAGFINGAPTVQPPVGGQAAVTLECVSCSRELTTANTDLRSDESQQRRATGDRLFQYVAATGSVDVFWGQNHT